MKKSILLIVFLMAPGFCLAAAGDKRIVEMWQCEAKEGKTAEEIQAHNTRWLAHTRKTSGSEDVRSYALATVVGDQSKFVFVDTFPNMAAWAAAKSAEDSEEGEAIENGFNELMDCEKNRLFESTEH